MSGPRRLLALAAAVVALSNACSGDDGASPGPGDLDVPPPDGAAVAVVDRAFEPADVEVVVGEAIRFDVEGDEEHTVTGDDLELDSGALRPGETYRFLTGDAEPGRIAYHCELHPSMTGTITIVAR